MPGLLRDDLFIPIEYYDLGMLLRKFREGKAKDLRDIVYALLGLSKNTFKSRFLRPDYEIKLQEAIQRTVDYIWTQLFEVDGPFPDPNDMPTWSMDEFLYAIDHPGNFLRKVVTWISYNKKSRLPYI